MTTAVIQDHPRSLSKAQTFLFLQPISWRFPQHVRVDCNILDKKTLKKLLFRQNKTTKNKNINKNKNLWLLKLFITVEGEKNAPQVALSSLSGMSTWMPQPRQKQILSVN